MRVTRVPRRQPDARADPRPARALRRLRRAVVRRDLPAAVRLARRLRAAARAAALRRRCARARRPRRAASSGCPSTARSRATTSPQAVLDDAARGCARSAGASTPGRRRRRRRARSPPRRATCARPATWSSTSRCSCCSSRSRSAALFGFRGNVLVREGSGVRQHRARSTTRSTRAGCSTTRRCRRSRSRSTTSPPTYEARRPAATAPRATFDADVTSCASPAPSPSRRGSRSTTRSNVDGTKVFLVGHGYAPTIHGARRRGQRRVPATRWSFLPQDGNFTSTGVVKVPDAQPPQLGFQAHLPADRRGRPGAAARSRPSPRRTTPRCSCRPGRATSASTRACRSRSTSSTPTEMDAARASRRSRPARPGSCPTASARSRFDGYDEFATFSVARDPGKGLALVAVDRRDRRADAVAAGPPPPGVGAGGARRRRAYRRRRSRASTRTEDATVADDVDALTSHARRHGAARTTKPRA